MVVREARELEHEKNVHHVSGCHAMHAAAARPSKQRNAALSEDSNASCAEVFVAEKESGGW
jgi:hypothetical protein